MFAGSLHPLDGNQYAKHLGVAEDAIKMGARYGLISDSDAKRAIRVIVSQADDMFVPDVLAAPAIIKEPAAFKDWFTGLMGKASKAQQGGNFGPRIEGHHPISVSSTHAAGAHLPIEQQVEFIQGLRADGYTPGTEAPHMVGLAKPVHTGNAPFNVHMDPVSGMTDEGVWQGIDFSDETDVASLVDRFENESAEPQTRLAEIASMQPGQRAVELEMAQQAGVDPRELMYTTTNSKGKTRANQIKDDLKKEEFDAQGLNKLVFGEGPTKRGGKKTSNKRMLKEDRPGANIVRRDLGLSGNEAFAQDFAGNWVQTLVSNNRRRRL